MQKIAASLCILLIAPMVAAADPPANQIDRNRRPNADDHKLAEKWRVVRLKAVKDQPSLGDSRQPASTIPKPFLDSPLAFGDIGTLRGYRFRVFKRLGNSEARVGIFEPRSPSQSDYAIRVGEPLHEVEVSLRGFDLSKIADGQEVKTQSFFIVSKTETNQTVTGAPRTLPVIEPFDSTYAEMFFERAVAMERYEARLAVEDPDGSKRARRAAKIMEQAVLMRRAANLRPAALLSNARHLIAAKLYPAAEKMLRRIIKDAPGSDAAIQAQKELDALPSH
jgi:hypothetical protein